MTKVHKGKNYHAVYDPKATCKDADGVLCDLIDECSNLKDRNCSPRTRKDGGQRVWRLQDVDNK